MAQTHFSVKQELCIRLVERKESLNKEDEQKRDE